MIRRPGLSLPKGAESETSSLAIRTVERIVGSLLCHAASMRPETTTYEIEVGSATFCPFSKA
jgi:hypothetical protein